MIWIPFVLAASMAMQVPTVFTSDAAPPEGLLELGDTQVELRDAPTMDADVTATLTRDSADEIRLLRVRVVTRRPGVLRSLEDDAVVRGADYGTGTHVPLLPPGTVVSAAEEVLAVGDEVAYLQDSPGGCYVWAGARVIDAMPCPSGDTAFLVERAPRVEFWGFLRTSDGQSGWILLAQHGPS